MNCIKVMRVGILILMMGIMTACSLGRADEPPTSTPPAPPTTTPLPIQTSTPILLPTQTTAIHPPINCVSRPDWPMYSVVTGDTLSSIATRTGTTPQELINANCLTNPDVLTVGQQLRVPRLLSPTSTPLPTLTSQPTQTPVPQMAGSVIASQQISGDAGNLLLLRGAPSVLDYNDVPFGIVRVEFYLISGNNRQLLGSDDNSQDGFRMVWTVPPSLAGQQLQAYGYNASNQLSVVSQTINVYSAPPQGQGCILTINTATNYFAQPHDVSLPALGSFAAGNTVEIVGVTLSGWWVFDASNSGGANGKDGLGYIPQTANVTQGQRCS